MKRWSCPIASFVFLSGLGCGGSQPAAKNPTAENGNAASEGSLSDYVKQRGGFASIGGVPGSESAQGAAPPAHGFRADLVDAKIKLDGVLNEWQERTTADVAIRGHAAARFSISVVYDETNLYFGAEVNDADYVRSERFAESEDHASLIVWFPGSTVAYEVGFFAGKPGDYAGIVKHMAGPKHGQALPGSKIIEAPASGGYTFEAVVPWSAFPEARDLRVGLRGVARYYDANNSGGVAIAATGPGEAGQPKSLPYWPTEPELALAEQLLLPNQLSLENVRTEVFGDVVGDASKERIALFGPYLTVTGSRFLGGKSFFYREMRGDIVGLELRDAAQHGKSDIVIKRRFKDRERMHERTEVLSFGESDEAKVIASEDAGEPPAQKAEPPPSAPRPQGEVTPRPRAATPASSENASAALLDQYKRTQGVPRDARPKVELEANVVADSRPEHLALFDRDLVVFGPGFMNGQQYAFISLSLFASGQDIREVTTRDVNGDGIAEILVRGSRGIQPAGGGDPVEQDVLAFYQVNGQAIQRVFAIETGRSQGNKRVQSVVQFVPAPGRKGFLIDVRPGKATGWTEKTFPWPQSPPGGTIEPLLLPWGGVSSLRYAWNGSSFAVSK